MSELTFEQMLEESFKTIRNGEVVDGTVIDVKPDEIILNIGYKADGIITRNEYTNEANVDLTTVVSVGDQMSAKVLKVNDGEGQVLLTYKRLAAEKGNERLKEAFENHEVLKAPVTQILGGGLSVVVDEARVFIPASLVSDTYEKDLSKYQGQEIEFVISEFNPRRNRVIGDRRQLLVAERAEKQKELFAKISVGDRMEGTVKNVTDFGAFIDLGGVDGLVHVSEISFERVGKPSDVLKVGQDVKVKVLAVDPEKDRISLSIKQTLPQPWDNITEKVAEGDVLEGTVKRLTSFGAFVEVFPGVEGLVHISQISHKHIATPNEVLASGEKVKVKVLNVNAEEHRLALSIKALQEKPAAEKKQEAPVEEEKVEIPEEDTGFTMADLVGDELKDQD